MNAVSTILKTCETVEETVAFFEEAGAGAQARLMATLNCDEPRVRNYFYRRGCKVTVALQPDGSRIITCNGFNTTGRETNRRQWRKRTKSHRLDHEPTLGYLLDTKGLAVGETLVVKGNRKRVAALLVKRFGTGSTDIRSQGDVIVVTRKK